MTVPLQSVHLIDVDLLHTRTAPIM
jgi:hypothetical protein